MHLAEAPRIAGIVPGDVKAMPAGTRFTVAAVAAALLTALPAGAAGEAAPTAITGAVTAVGPTTATVAGTVNPGGVSTTWYVDYGTSTSYGSKSASASAGAGTSDASVSASLTGLTPGTTYHYRVTATSTAGTAHGSDGIFTTPAPPGVVTGAASGVTPTGATLHGSVDGNGRATTYWFEYGTSTGYGSKTAEHSAGSGSNSVAESVSISGLQPGHTYHFRIVANSDGGTSNGADATFTTNGAPSVSTSAASSVAPTSAKLNGTVSANGLTTTWWFEYGTTTAYGSKTASHGAGSGTSAQKEAATITGLKTATVYHFRIVASNSAGTTHGADQTFSTSLAPGVQTGPAQSVGPSTATLTGSVDPRGRTTTWWFQYGTSTSYGKQTTTTSAGSKAGARGVSAALQGLVASTLYHFRLVAKSDAGTTVGPDATFQTAGVTLTAAGRRVVFGRTILLSGSIPTQTANSPVTIYAQPYGQTSPHSIAVVLTRADGTWSYLAKPTIRTDYLAGWGGGTTAPFGIGVHPAVSFVRTRTGALKTRVVAGTGFPRRIVQLQRRTAAGRWVTIKRARLGALSRAQFKVVLPRGRSVLRVAISVNQAGAGYLGGTSRTIVVRRA
jgi:hypothetical protein